MSQTIAERAREAARKFLIEDMRARNDLTVPGRIEALVQSYIAFAQQVRLEEAQWWEHLGPDCEAEPHTEECIYCQRIAEIKAALKESQ